MPPVFVLYDRGHSLSRPPSDIKTRNHPNGSGLACRVGSSLIYQSAALEREILMVKSSQNLNINFFTLACCILVGENRSRAWSNVVVVGERSKPFDCIALRTSFALHLASSSSSSPLPSSSSLSYQTNHQYEDEKPTQNCVNNISNSDKEYATNLRLQLALEAARDADRTSGLCSPASNHAWKIVDDVYSSSSASREVEDTVKRILGREESVWGQHF